jgi:ABC-type sugar transport system permease subunit
LLDNINILQQLFMEGHPMAAITNDRQAPPSGFRRWLNRTANTRTAWLYLFPAFLVMSIITFYPLIYEVWMSTTDYNIKNLRFDAPAANGACWKTIIKFSPAICLSRWPISVSGMSWPLTWSGLSLMCPFTWSSAS